MQDDVDRAPADAARRAGAGPDRNVGHAEDTAARVRRVLAARSGVVEKRMVGGLSFTVDGHLCCGVTSTGLMVRLGADELPRALEEPHVAPMTMGGKALKAFVVVSPEGYESDAALAAWVARALAFVSRLD